jgi:hypothetical protein
MAIDHLNCLRTVSLIIAFTLTATTTSIVAATLSPRQFELQMFFLANQPNKPYTFNDFQVFASISLEVLSGTTDAKSNPRGIKD